MPCFLARTGAFRDAIQALELQQRGSLLDRLDADRCPRGLVALLVGRDRDLYCRLLKRQELRDSHLLPLQGVPDAQWWDLAKLAEGSGHTPAAVADAALYSSWVVVTSGTGIDWWRRFEKAFGEKKASSDPVEREIAEAGLRLVGQGVRRAEERARRKAIEGFG